MHQNVGMALAVAVAAPSTRTPLLSVEGLTVRFDTFRALDGVDLEIRAGETVALAGENGAGKSTLVRCIGGDIAPSSGRILISGERIGSDPAAQARRGVAVVWQDLALCDNLDIASNLLLGNESGGLMRSEARFHGAAAALLTSLGIGLLDTTRSVGTLSGGERQLLAVARAMSGRPRLLILDEPTGALGVNESAQVEQLTANVRAQGTTVLLVSHDIEQMFRLADRITVLRHGRVVADVDPEFSQPEDVVALISGQQTDSSARRQLSRLHGLADRLASTDPSSSLPLILSTLGGALGTTQLCIHLVDGDCLRAAGDLGSSRALMRAWSELPLGAAGGPVGLAAASESTVVDYDIRFSPAWTRWRELATDAGIGSSWSVPLVGTGGLTGVITVFREARGHPPRHELDLVTLYSGYVASAVERERLLGEVTARNRTLETIQEMLETLAGPVPLAEGLIVVLHSLCTALQAETVGLLSQDRLLDAPQRWSVVDSSGAEVPSSSSMRELAADLLGEARNDGKAQHVEDRDGGGGRYLAVTFAAPGGPGVLLAHWPARAAATEGTALMEDAANSLRLARERQESERARREASALRRSQELQRGFLSRLSHELRTPLTAIGGYASSLMAPDVTWDGATEKRFVTRIGAESARLNRLVDDLLDFSAIESSTLRLQADWCEVALVLDAAIGCVTAAGANPVKARYAPDLPVVWADHDRLEQVFVNLLENALRHNPPGTLVLVEAAPDEGGVVIRVTDNGAGLPDDVVAALFKPRQRGHGPSAGAGLGLSIAKGIVDAHDGRIVREQLRRGTRFSVHLPIGGPGPSHRYAEDHEHRDG
jgi:signal transduction histidine kinase/ABC-type multidrug transport system ATPase subunit